MKHLKYTFVILSLMLVAPLHAQEVVKVKTLLKNARSAIKNSRDQEKNEKALLEAMDREDVTQEKKAEFYYLCGELQRSINDGENMKLYLKQPYDTLRFFSTILKMNQHLLCADSVEQQVGRFNWREKGCNMILKYHSNLLNGGKFLLKRGNVKEAFQHFDVYLSLPDAPMMASHPTLKTDSQLSKVAYWATISAYNAKQPANALKYIDHAIAGADSLLRISLTEYKAQCFAQTGDNQGYVQVLKQGVSLYPSRDYFYLNLMAHYLQTDSISAALALSDSMLVSQGERAIYWFGKCQAHERRCEYEDVVTCADRTLNLDTTFVDAYYNKGIALLNQATAFSKTMNSDVRSAKAKRDRVKLNDLYMQARTPLELLRVLRPDDKQRWGLPLYTIYLNLNLGKEFSEIERELNGK